MKGLTHQQSRELKKQIVEYRKQNHMMKEVMEHFGVTRWFVRSACRNVQWDWVRDKEAMSIGGIKGAQIANGDCTDRKEKAFETMRRYYPQWTYVSGFRHVDGHIMMRHSECGKISSQSFVSIRHGRVLCCPHCIALQEQQEKVRQLIDKEIRARQHRNKQQLQQKRHIIKQLKRKPRECSVCGKWTLNKVYCSMQCMGKAYNATKYVKRRVKIQAVLVDKDITLQKLYKRDKGICYLCGDVCDWRDGVTINGTFIAGNKYPSIDHVRPLALGGCHAWNNVRLAHRYCNSIKGDNPLSKIAI